MYFVIFTNGIVCNMLINIFTKVLSSQDTVNSPGTKCYRVQICFFYMRFQNIKSNVHAILFYVDSFSIYLQVLGILILTRKQKYNICILKNYNLIFTVMFLDCLIVY